MPLSTSSPPVSPTGNKSDKESIRTNRKRIWGLVRNDFSFLPPDSLSTTAVRLRDINQVAEDPASSHNATIDPERVVEWRDYTFASSDPSSEDEYVEQALTTATQLEEESNRRVTAQQETQGASTGLASKIRRKRKSLLSHLRPSENINIESPQTSPQSPRSQTTSQPSDELAEGAAGAGDAGDAAEGTRATDEEAARVRLKAERKRRRRRRLDEERTWNQGLDFWAKRRDAWCCARVCHAERPSEGGGGGQDESYDDISHHHRFRPKHDSGTHEANASWTATILNVASSVDAHPIPSTTTAAVAPLLPPSSVSDTHTTLHPSHAPNRPDTPASHPSSTAAPTNSPASTTLTSPQTSDPHLPSTATTGLPSNTQIPLTAPILPSTDASRSQLNSPRAYGAIYSKVVVQGLTPSVPINLKAMTHALVQGWKQDGEWPPTAATVVEPSMQKAEAESRGQESVVGGAVRRGKDRLKGKAGMKVS